MRPLVVISDENAASQNMKRALLRLAEFEVRDERFWSAESFDMAEYPGSIVEIVPEHDAECYIFASTHKSAAGTPSFSAHTPGNWGGAMLGGKERTLNFAWGSRVKAAAQTLQELSQQSLKWPVSVEVDHHGPTLLRPVLFVEIGSGTAQWGNGEAGAIAAKAVLSAARCTGPFPCHVGFGGTHYSPKFTPKILRGGIAIGHIISGYSLERDGADEGMVRQAWEKNVERPLSALVDWKGVKGEMRKKLIGTLEGLGIPWERV